MSSDKKPKFGVCSKQVNPTKKFILQKNFSKIYEEKMIFNKLSMRPPPAATTHSSLDRSLRVTPLMKLGVMAAQAVLTRSFSSATLGDLSLHEMPSMWFQILYSGVHNQG